MSIALDRHIETTPGTRGGRPRIAGSRITVGEIAVLHARLGQSPEEIAGRYDLPLAAVYAAIAYYHDHRPAIDADLAEDEALARAFKQRNPSLLQARLRALNGD